MTLTVGELKEKLSQFPDDWTVRLNVESNNILLPWNEYDIEDVHVFDEGELHIHTERHYIVNKEGNSI